MADDKLIDLIEKESIEHIGRIINRVRKRKSITQIDLGNMSQTSQMTVQRLESGKGSATRLDAFMSVIRALDIPLSDVFFELEKGTVGSKQLQSQWDVLTMKINALAPSDREWIFSIIEKILDRKV